MAGQRPGTAKPALHRRSVGDRCVEHRRGPGTARFCRDPAGRHLWPTDETFPRQRWRLHVLVRSWQRPVCAPGFPFSPGKPGLLCEPIDVRQSSPEDAVRCADHTASQWLDLAEGRLRLDRLCRNGGRSDFLPLGFAHSSRGKKVDRRHPPRRCGPQRVRRRSPSASRSPSRPRWSRARNS